jgi:hypothetical protein
VHSAHLFLEAGGKLVAILRSDLVSQTDERTFRMSTTKRQTMSKMNRERALKEKRALKQERKDQMKLAAAAATEAEAPVAAPVGP